MVAKEVGATFRVMIVEKREHILLETLENKLAEFTSSSEAVGKATPMNFSCFVLPGYMRIWWGVGYQLSAVHGVSLLSIHQSSSPGRTLL